MKIRELKRLPSDFDRFVSPKEMARKLRKLAMIVGATESDVRMHVNLKFRYAFPEKKKA